MRTTWSFASAGQLIFGADAVLELETIATRLRASRVLVITDAVLASVGILDAVRGPLEKVAQVAVFDGGVPEPAISLAVECAEFARQHQPQLIVGLGGGSNIDLAKIVAALLAHGGQPRDYFGEEKVPGPVLPLVCVPTTAGTGSEVSPAAVLTDLEQHIKVSSLSHYLRPLYAVVDPKLTLTCPAKVTADSGIDALTHAIEAYLAIDNANFPVPQGQVSIYQGTNPFGDLFAETAIRRVGKSLARAVQHPSDLNAREDMALAATLGGLAFSNVGVGIVHALEYPIGAAVHCSHGAGNGLLLPYALRFNREVRLERLAKIGEWLGVSAAGMSAAEAADAAIAGIEQLRAEIGIPHRLRELKVQRSQLPEFAKKSFGISRLMRMNPRPVTEADLLAILEESW